MLAADNGANRLAEAPFDHGTPGNQAETEPVVEHREAAASEQDGAAVDARRSVTVGERAVGEAGFRGDRARCGFHVAVAELREQIRCEDEALTLTFGEALLNQEFLARDERVTYGRRKTPI